MSCRLELFVVLLCFTSVSGQLCDDDEYRCEDGRCIPAEYVCDTIVDCRGGGDEVGACFHCSKCSQLCLGNTEWCDGKEDCLGGVDEYCSEGPTEEVFVGGHYYLTSPNYPLNYNSNYGGLQTFSTFAGSRLLLTFEFILIEPGDYLLVGNGNSSSGQVLKWSGGPTNQLKVLSAGSSMWMKFLTDNSGTEVGFHGSVDIFNESDAEFNCSGGFDCMNGVCLPTIAVCDDVVNCKGGADEYGAHCVCDVGDNYQCDDGNCIPQYLVCDDYTHCSGGEDENEDCFYCPVCYYDCLADNPGWCDGSPTCYGEHIYCPNPLIPQEVFVMGHYNLTTPNYPNNYDIYSAFWEFTTYEDSRLLLTFDFILTEAYYDYVFVGNGNSSSGQVLKWSGGPANNELRVLSSGNTLWIKFLADDIITETGFSCSVSVFNESSSEFRCDGGFDCMNGVCLPMDAVCDDVVNCKGGVDEKNSICYGTPTPTLTTHSQQSTARMTITHRPSTATDITPASNLTTHIQQSTTDKKTTLQASASTPASNPTTNSWESTTDKTTTLQSSATAGITPASNLTTNSWQSTTDKTTTPQSSTKKATPPATNMTTHTMQSTQDKMTTLQSSTSTDSLHSTTNQTHIPQSSTTTGDQSCPPESLTYSGVYLSFPTTADAAIANSSETCGEDTSNPNEPLATRLCLSSEWDSPEFLPCYSPDEVADEIENIADTPVTDENVEEVASDLALLTTQTNDLEPDQITDVAESLEHIADTGSSSPEVTDSVIGTVNNIMTVDENELHDTKGTASVVTSLEQQVSNVQQNPGNYTDVQDNVGVQAVKVDPEITKGLTFVVQTPVDLNATDRLETDLSEETTKLYNNDGEVVGNDTTTSIYISPAVLDRITEGHVNIPISFIIYKDARLFQTSDAEVSDGPVISSQVISATVENISVGQLPQDSLVITRFLTSNGNDNSTYRKCVFWVPSSDDTPDGQWSEDGCQLVESSSQLTECHCDHLTSFAVLVGSDLSGKAEDILNILTIIASCMSIVALIVYSLTLLMFKTLRKMEMTKMRVNLSLSLLAFYVTFLLSDIAVGKGTMCKNFATAIHYFCLVTVSWMTVEAVYLFNMFVRVMQSRSGMKYYFPVSFLLAYSVPLVPVLVVRFHPGNEGYENYCFLPPGNYLYYGFLVEVGLLIAVNTIIFIALVRAVVFRKNMSQSAEANRKEIISRIRFLIIVWVLLGLSWIFGLLAAIPNRKTIAFEVLFCIFISLQGVFVLVIVLLTNKEAKSKISSMRSTFKDGISTGMAKVTARSETYRLTKKGNVCTAGSSEVYSSNSEATSGAYVNSFTDITE